jgi:hypothetical protein
MLEIKVSTLPVQIAGDLQCACREQCGTHEEICRDPVELLLDLGRGVLLAACAECAKGIVQKFMEKLFQ